MRHFMRGSCQPHERAPPFVLNMPYEGAVLDNLVIEIEDMNPQDDPNSLNVTLYDGSGNHDTLSAMEPLRRTTQARKRIYSFGLSSIELATRVCNGPCRTDGVATFSIVVRCTNMPVRFSVIAMATPTRLEINVPTHGEVCPSNWVYHSIPMPDLNRSSLAHVEGIRFDVHVHTGDVYFLVSRWRRTPGFAACNHNEVAMTNQTEGIVDLCGLQTMGSERTTYGLETSGPELGFLGLYGGLSCAYYTVLPTYLVSGDNCSTVTYSECDR